MSSAQRIVSVVHGQVVWKPHVCVICALFAGRNKLAPVHHSPFPDPPERYTCRTPLPLEPNKPRRIIRVFELKIIHCCQTAVSSKQA